MRGRATGRIVREAKVASEPEALIGFLGGLDLRLARIGLEAGPLSQWLQAALVKAGFEAVLLETRHVKAALSAMIVKTDRKDAPGIAQLLRMGWFRPVHKSAPAQEVGPCWSRASSCRPRCATWSSVCGVFCAASGSRWARSAKGSSRRGYAPWSRVTRCWSGSRRRFAGARGAEGRVRDRVRPSRRRLSPWCAPRRLA